MATCGSNTTWRCHKVVIPSGRLKKQTITAERPLMRGTNGNLCTRRRRRRAQTPGTPPFRALRPRRRGTTEASSTHTKPAANGGGGGQARPGRGRVLSPPRPRPCLSSAGQSASSELAFQRRILRGGAPCRCRRCCCGCVWSQRRHGCGDREGTGSGRSCGRFY